MALTKDEPRRFETSSLTAAIASTAIYQGACVGSVRASGQAAGGTFASATHRFAGFAATRAAIGERVTIDAKGRVILTVAGTSASSVNAVVYASDDNTFNVAGSGIAIGRISWVQDDGKCVVDFDAGLDAAAPYTANYASGNSVLVVADRVVDSLNLTPPALLDGRFIAGQPVGITRPVTKGGKMVCRFVASECTAFGTPTLADYSGYDANGVVTGVVSRTGLPSMLKVTPGADTSEGFQFTSPATSLLTKAVNGKIGVWVYIETQPGYQAGGTPAGTLEMALTRNAANSFAQGVLVYFNTNQLKEGWNFLVFMMRNPAAYVTSGGVTEYHPYGVHPTSNGTGADSDIVNNNLGSIRFLYSGTGITGTNIYFDSVWTDFDVTAQAFIGHDTADSSITDISLPKFEQYGWKGYFTANANYWDGAESRIWTDYSTGLNAYSDTLYSAGWDAINHTLQHLPGSAASPTMATLTNAGEIAYEIMAMHALLRSAGFSRGAEFYAAPISAQSRLSEAVIKGCGYKLQRIARGQNIQVTPWGIPNPSHVGSIGMGSPVASAYVSTTNGVSTPSTGLNNITKMRNLIDCMIAYGASFSPFTHTLQTSGDDGSGNGTPTVNTNCMASLFTLAMDYIAEKEAAGLIRVRDGFTGFFYGTGR